MRTKNRSPQIIPTRIDELCALCDNADDLLIDDMIISEKRSFNFSGVTNTTEIWGRTLDYDYVASKCENSGATYNTILISK